MVHPGWTVGQAARQLVFFLGGLFLINEYFQSQHERAEQRPFIRKQFPYNALYLERGGDPEKLHLLKPITDQVYDPYPYYGENSIFAKVKAQRELNSHNH